MAPENLNDFSVSSRQWFFSSLVQFWAKESKMDHVKSLTPSMETSKVKEMIIVLKSWKLVKGKLMILLLQLCSAYP